MIGLWNVGWMPCWMVSAFTKYDGSFNGLIATAARQSQNRRALLKDPGRVFTGKQNNLRVCAIF